MPPAIPEPSAHQTDLGRVGVTKIPFNRPCTAGLELQYVQQSIASGHISGGGPFAQLCQQLIEQEIPGTRALLTTSCTDALEMIALLLEVGPGDEVIIPSFTFVSTANAFALRGARPVFADIRSDTLNLDPAQVERLVSPQTKAIVAVHYAGVGCDMDGITAIAEEHGIRVVEDNAHGFLGRYKDRPLGSFGCMATLSFHETKNINCGEGGALLVNDAAYVERAEIVREKGTNRSQFFRGQVDKYTWVSLGSSHVPADVIAAYLYGQLEARSSIQAKRKAVWDFYQTNLRSWADMNGVSLPYVPGHCMQPYHMFYLLMPTLEVRRRLIEHLRELGIMAVFHYIPLHSSPMGQSYGGFAGQCPVTEDISARLVRLPFYNDLGEEDLDRIIGSVTSLSM